MVCKYFLCVHILVTSTVIIVNFSQSNVLFHFLVTFVKKQLTKYEGIYFCIFYLVNISWVSVDHTHTQKKKKKRKVELLNNRSMTLMSSSVIYTSMFISALLIIPRILKQSKYLLMDDNKKKLWNLLNWNIIESKMKWTYNIHEQTGNSAK